MISFSIIIPNLNGQALLNRLLPSLLIAIHHCPASTFQVILVDNGSVDDSSASFTDFCQHHHLSHQVIQLPTNLGFAKAVNLGILASTSDYAVICNNDLTLDQFWFSQILSAINQYPQATCFCGTVLNSTGTQIESQGIDFHYSGKCLQLNHGLPLNLGTSNIQPVWGSSAALVVYQTTTIKKNGLFNQQYFAYLEDVDLAFRLHQNKLTTILNPLALCYHLGGATADKSATFRSRQIFRNWFIFISQNYSPLQIIKYLPQIFIERLRNFSYLLKSINGRKTS